MDVVTITGDEVRAAVSMSDAIAAVRRGFVDLVAGQLEMPPRTVLRDGQFLLMSAAHRPTRSAIVKTLRVDFSHKPSITGNVVWTNLGNEGALVIDAGPLPRCEPVPR